MITPTCNGSNKDAWLPHELMQKILFDRNFYCHSLLKCNQIDPFLNRMVTGDAKSCILCIIIFRVEEYDIAADIPLQPAQKSVYIRRRFSYAFGGTGK